MVNRQTDATPQDGADEARRALTSLMMDGQASPQEAAQWQAAWASTQPDQCEPQRDDWTLYNAIGEALRAPPSDRSEPDPVWCHGTHTVAERRARAARIQAAVLREAAVDAPAPEPRVIPWPRRSRTRLNLAVAAAVTGFLVVGTAFFGTRLDTDPVAATGDWMAWTRLGATPSATSSATVGAGLQWSGSGQALNSGSGVAWGTAPAAASVSTTGIGAYREILRLPQGPADRPFEAMQVLYSDGVNTISVHIQPSVPGVRQPYAQRSERLNALGMQRDGAWLTLSGDVPPAVLQQFATVMPLPTR